MAPETEALIRQVTRGAAVAALLGGAALLVLELVGEGVSAPAGTPPRAWMLTTAGALVLAGPLFWVLARASMTVLGASACLLLGAALFALGAVREGSDAGFDMGLGLCLAAVAVWTLWAQRRERR